MTLQMPPAPIGADRPLILMRVYPGRHESAVERAQVDAEDLTRYGYFPVGQSYAAGNYADSMVLLAIFLSFFGIGLLMLLFMAAVPRVGSLAVTYELRDAMPSPVR